MSKLVVTWIVYAALGAGIIGGVYWVWQHFVANPYREQGREEMVPLMKKQTDQLNADTVAFKAIKGSMEAITENSKRVNAAVTLASKTNGTRQARETAKVDALNSYTAKGQTECMKTSDAITRGLRQ